MTEITFGGECHWCIAPAFQSLRCVQRVEQGFISSITPYDSWIEAVIVHFSAEEIELMVLIKVHTRTHASTSNHSHRSKYRSAIYSFEEEQKKSSEMALEKVQSDFEFDLITRVLRFVLLKRQMSVFLNYYARDA